MKTIKSIRILDSKSPAIRSQSTEQQPPEIFSFSKKDLSQNFRITEDEIQGQKIEIGKL